MIFELAGAHADFKPLIAEILGRLAEKYPWAGLRKVHLYEPAAGDHSMANANTPGALSLNRYWFGQDPGVLQQAALDRPDAFINGRWVLWHGAMVEEPLHVLTHEFGHVLRPHLPDYERQANAGWIAATAASGDAVSGYACADPDEFWAESFAAVELGVAELDLIEQLLAGHR